METTGQRRAVLKRACTDRTAFVRTNSKNFQTRTVLERLGTDLLAIHVMPRAGTHDTQVLQVCQTGEGIAADIKILRLHVVL